MLLIDSCTEEEEDEEEEDENSNPVQSFLNRMENDWDRRKKEKPERFVTKEDLIEKIEFLNSYEAFK